MSSNARATTVVSVNVCSSFLWHFGSSCVVRGEVDQLDKAVSDVNT
jgi:hypothetical protein